jgi:hypothetical protein
MLNWKRAGILKRNRWDYPTDFGVFHGAPDPLVELLAAIVVARASHGPDEAENEPGLHQLLDARQAFRWNRLLTLQSNT